MQKMINKIIPTFPYVIWMGFIIVILSVIFSTLRMQTKLLGSLVQKAG